MAPNADEEEAPAPIKNTYSPFGVPIHFKPSDVTQAENASIFCLPPLLGPLLFDNTDSDARDHCANERTFLSYLRLSVYMTIVSIAIVISFHLKSTPSHLELRIAKPLGLVFWCLSVICLVVGCGNYIKTVEGYGKRSAIVQTGWKTQSVLTIIACSIVGVCVLFLATNSKRQ